MSESIHFLIPESKFCEDNSIPISSYYKLKKEGKGPKITKIGRRNYLTPENAREWLRGLE